jgi:hypothetical protein
VRRSLGVFNKKALLKAGAKGHASYTGFFNILPNVQGSPERIADVVPKIAWAVSHNVLLDVAAHID